MLAQHELDRVTAADRCVGGEGGGRSGGALEEKGPIEEREMRGGDPASQETCVVGWRKRN